MSDVGTTFRMPLVAILALVDVSPTSGEALAVHVVRISIGPLLVGFHYLFLPFH
jgi:hypothetical protein